MGRRVSGGRAGQPRNHRPLQRHGGGTSAKSVSGGSAKTVPASRRTIQHHLPIQRHQLPGRLTTYRSSIFLLKHVTSWHLAFTAEVETPTPYGPAATSQISTLRKTDRPQSNQRLKVHLRHLVNMGPSENATHPSLASFDGIKTGQESARFEGPTDLDASSRKWSINTGCESGVGVLRGRGKVAWHRSLRERATREDGVPCVKVANFIPDGRHIRTSNRASRISIKAAPYQN
jgi:hypothetical protein